MKTIVSPGALAAACAALFGVAGSAHAADYATVVSATPVSSSVSVPRQDCADVQQLVQPQPSGAGALIGAIAGGVVGNQFGHGFGRAAATGIGAVAGSAIGNNVEASNSQPATVTSRRCRTVSSYENRVVGYDVVYEYNGQRYSTRLPQDPGPRLAIDIRPAGGAPLDRVGPPTTTYGAVPPAYAEAQSYSAAPVYYNDVAPAAYYAPAPAYYYPSPAAYIGPAVIGAGIGYWIGSSWHRGYRPGYRGGHRWR